MKRVLLVVILLSLVILNMNAQQRNIEDFYRDFTAEWVRGNPNLATASRYFTGEEQDRLERQLTPETDAYRRSRIQLARKGLAELGKFDRAKMSPSQQTSADLMQWQLQTAVDEERYLDFTFPLEQMNGVNIGLVETLTVRHPLLTLRDAENYIAALKQAPQRMEEAISRSRTLAEKGIVPPRFILTATIRQMRDFTTSPAEQNPFVVVLTQKMETIAEISAVRREELRKEAMRIVGDQVYAAWKKGMTLLESQLPKSTDDAGIWRLKGGSEAYVYFLRRFTTTNLTPDQIHEIGLREVARIESEMDAILRRLGRSEGSVKDRIEKLKLDLQYPNPKSEQSRARIMVDIETILRDAEKRAALLFDAKPKSPVIAQPFPTFREDNAAANYVPPPPDASRPGVFQYPRRLNNMTKFGLRSLVYHESVPGHHFQIALQVENDNLPRFQRVRALGGISAHSEGWALYAERLAAESAWYDQDLEGQLGQLDAALFRARRLVVDTGIHSKHWTRQQGIDYGIEASEVERYVVYPGQACSYMIGQLKIIELREQAKGALGDKFSLREFHNVVLNAGTVPLGILERVVSTWIREKGGKV